MKRLYCTLFAFLTFTLPACATVTVTSPAPGSTVTSPVQYKATATTTCSKGVASMGIYVDNQLIYIVNGAQLDEQISMITGTQHSVVEEWDYCGGASYATVNLTVDPLSGSRSHLASHHAG